MIVVTTGTSSKISILIIEQHEAVRHALRVRLGVSAHLDVIEAVPNPETAQHLIQAHRPNVILLGLQKGTDEDLFRLSVAVRQMVQNMSDVIVLAPYADEVEREVLLRAGAKRYLLKQINSPKLIREIETVADFRIH